MQKNLKEAQRYIRSQWKEMTFHLSKDKGVHIGLPHPFVAPSGRRSAFANDQFYWDSYFIILGLLFVGKLEISKGMVENFVYLQKKYGIIPSRNRLFNLGISQPPFLSSMVMEIYQTKPDKRWLKKMIPVIEKELNEYWLDAVRPEKHMVYQGLSRYCDHHINHNTSEHESGWDMTTRFRERCLRFLPVDLNSLLYKYETDLHVFHGLLGNDLQAEDYLKRSEKRKRKMNQLMWSGSDGAFYDYNYRTHRQRHFFSVACYYPMWAKLASKKQAKALVKNLKILETKWGLANTRKVKTDEFKQWDYPNGWANQQWIVIQALLNYGYREDALRIAKKWIRLNLHVFEKTGKFWEKYNVVRGDIGKDGRYPTQYGFGWTNAVFIKLLATFPDDLL